MYQACVLITYPWYISLPGSGVSLRIEFSTIILGKWVILSKILQFHLFLGQFLSVFYDLWVVGKGWPGATITLVQTSLNCKDWLIETSLFPVFDSQKSKDWTAGPVFLRSGPVWLQSFSSLRTRLQNTNQNINMSSSRVPPLSLEQQAPAHQSVWSRAPQIQLTGHIILGLFSMRRTGKGQRCAWFTGRKVVLGKPSG